jgi:hypothetical protein
MHRYVGKRFLHVQIDINLRQMVKLHKFLPLLPCTYFRVPWMYHGHCAYTGKEDFGTKEKSLIAS